MLYRFLVQAAPGKAPFLTNATKEDGKQNSRMEPFTDTVPSRTRRRTRPRWQNCLTLLLIPTSFLQGLAFHKTGCVEMEGPVDDRQAPSLPSPSHPLASLLHMAQQAPVEA